MIKIVNPEDCCGCRACEQKCPRQCITLNEDNEGFLYPKVDESRCIDCGLCNKVCPMQKGISPIPPIKILAAYNKNEEIRKESSSGGIFTLLAEKVIDEGGVVFGAKFNEQWEVVLDFSETKQGLAEFRGSKYVQADVKETFKLCEQFLRTGRKVLFSGTPCQIAGLKHFLVKEYSNLLTVDVVCHGVPSPKVWRLYLQSLRKRLHNRTAFKRILEKVPFCSSLNTLPLIKNIRFRDKSDGWKKFRFILELAEASTDSKESSGLFSYIYNESLDGNLFMKAFLSDLILRPSCYSCPFRGTDRRQADISIADFWGVDEIMPSLDDDKGLSLVLLNTQKGELFLPINYVFLREENLNEASNYNGGLQNVLRLNPRREQFFKMIESNDIVDLLDLYTLPERLFEAKSRPVWKRYLSKCKQKYLTI